jgi:hypothetical protein
MSYFPGAATIFDKLTDYLIQHYSNTENLEQFERKKKCQLIYVLGVLISNGFCCSKLEYEVKKTIEDNLKMILNISEFEQIKENIFEHRNLIDDLVPNIDQLLDYEARNDILKCLFALKKHLDNGNNYEQLLISTAIKLKSKKQDFLMLNRTMGGNK